MSSEKSNHSEALRNAVINGHLDDLESLIQDGVDIFAVDKLTGNTLLHYAAEQNNPKIANLLIEKGLNVNALNLANMTPLHTAINKSNVAVAKVFIKNGAKVDTINTLGKSPLYSAIDKKLEDIVPYLINTGAELNDHYGNTQSTALHMAAARCNLNIFMMLLVAGADITAKDFCGRTPLDQAITSAQHVGNFEIVNHFKVKQTAPVRTTARLMQKCGRRGKKIKCPILNNNHQAVMLIPIQNFRNLFEVLLLLW